jgi:hypothetical protein
VNTVPDGRVTRMATMLALPLVGIEQCTNCWHMVADQAAAGPRVSVIILPEAVLTHLPRHQTDNGWAIVGVGAMAFAPSHMPTWRAAGSRYGGAFFPRVLVQFVGLEGGASHYPPLGHSHANGPGCVAVGYASVSVAG